MLHKHTNTHTLSVENNNIFTQRCTYLCFTILIGSKTFFSSVDAICWVLPITPLNNVHLQINKQCLKNLCLLSSSISMILNSKYSHFY